MSRMARLGFGLQKRVEGIANRHPGRIGKAIRGTVIPQARKALGSLPAIGRVFRFNCGGTAEDGVTTEDTGLKAEAERLCSIFYKEAAKALIHRDPKDAAIILRRINDRTDIGKVLGILAEIATIDKTKAKLIIRVMNRRFAFSLFDQVISLNEAMREALYPDQPKST